MLKWTSESEYFLSFENFFADTIYHIQSKSNHFTPSAAHARRGVIMHHYYSLECTSSLSLVDFANLTERESRELLEVLIHLLWNQPLAQGADVD